MKKETFNNKISRPIMPALRMILGGILILLGLAGLVLPVLQGWLFLILGILVLSKDVPFVKRLINRLEEHSPRLGRSMEYARRKMLSLKMRLKRGFHWDI